MSIFFEKIKHNFCLCYAPESPQAIDYINNNMDNSKPICIKKVFHVTNDLLINGDSEDIEETFRFKIGEIKDGFIALNNEVFSTNHHFFFDTNINIKPSYFIATRSISILRKFDEVIDGDLYIITDDNTHDGISLDLYKLLIKKFPTTTELDKYSQQRIASILKEIFPNCEKYAAIFNTYIENKSNELPKIKSNDKANINAKIELAQFNAAYDDLNDLLCHSEAIDEPTWQEKVKPILRFIYPQYIYATREVLYKGIDAHNKKPDFVLVDTNGFVDILELKKATVNLLVKYRNNYSPSKEFAGVVQQVEKYIFCLNTIEKAKTAVCEKLKKQLDKREINLEIKIINPRGLILAGRSNEFNEQQKQDFEIIKRQYNHIVDIMTYDDLLLRLKNIKVSLEKEISDKV